MKILTHTYRLRISKADKELINDLKKINIRTTTFIREAFREKIQRDMPNIILKEKHNQELIECPF